MQIAQQVVRNSADHQLAAAGMDLARRIPTFNRKQRRALHTLYRRKRMRLMAPLLRPADTALLGVLFPTRF